MVFAAVVVKVLAFFALSFDGFDGFAGTEGVFDDLVGFDIAKFAASESGTFSWVDELGVDDEPIAVFPAESETFNDVCGGCHV